MGDLTNYTYHKTAVVLQVQELGQLPVREVWQPVAAANAAAWHLGREGLELEQLLLPVLVNPEKIHFNSVRLEL